MNLSYQSTIASLSNAIDLFSRAPGNAGDLAARLYDLTRIIFDNKLADWSQLLSPAGDNYFCRFQPRLVAPRACRPAPE